MTVRVGLTGGIASGKSTVSAMLAELGAVIIDADVLAREVVGRGTPGLAAVVEEFGPGLLTADGDLDRPAMGALVFGDDAARGRLEAIIHPLVHRRAAELEATPGGALAAAQQMLAEAVSTGEIELDYLAAVDAATMVAVPDEYRGPALALVAATVGTTRLIDNVELTFPDPELVDQG